jgi:NAD(P)-dependent dehydrogenase (short-subunit alcohol dehydrogenase family)
MLLKDKIALVTAGASGMGRAAAEVFAKEGAHVIVVDVNADNAKDTVAGIEAAGGSAAAEIVDVRDLGALEALANKVQSEHGKLHVLYNNVGIPGAAGQNLTQEEWDTSIEINARASFFLSGYLTEALKAGGADGGASVIFTSSTSGLIGSPFSPLYSFTKGGIIALVRSMALAMATDGVRVNAVAPGMVDTPGLKGFFRIDDPAEIQKRKEAFAATIPMARPSQPEEIANVVLFLASPLSSYVTGVTIPVDGGVTAK